jgi:hypothetical protein
MEMSEILKYLPEEAKATKDPGLETWEKLIDALLTETEDEVEAIELKKKKKIAIEFECDGCCKKVLNGNRIFFIPIINVIVLIPPLGERLLLKVFSCGHIVDKEKMKAIVIPISRICSVEIGAEQIDC